MWGGRKGKRAGAGSIVARGSSTSKEETNGEVKKKGDGRHPAGGGYRGGNEKRRENDVRLPFRKTARLATEFLKEKGR